MSTIIHFGLVPLILRLGLAVVFIFHGFGKVQGEGAEFGTNWMSQAPDPLPRPLQAAVAWGELVGGVALAVGLLTRLAAAGLAAIMVGAIATVHGQHGFSLPMGYEFNFLILIVCAALILGGGGFLSVDRMLFRKRRPA